MRREGLTVLVTVAVVVAGVGPAVAVAADGSGGSAGTNAQVNESRSNDSSVEVGAGQQLSTVVTQIDSEVRTEVGASVFAFRYERAGADGRAEAIATRSATLRERADALRSEYREVTAMYVAGNLTEAQYGQRLAALNTRADDLVESASQLQRRADGVSELRLRAAGVRPATIDTINESVSPVTGAGVRTLTQVYTGQQQGRIQLEARDGLRLEVESERGERSREVERSGDGSTAFTVAQSNGLETAREALETPVDGEWTLQRATVHETEGYYRFTFVLANTSSTTGEAAVRVDGSGGQVVRLRSELERAEEVEQETDERADEPEEENEAEDDRLALVLAAGTPAPNETVTLRALAGEQPVAGATVTMNEAVVGTTDSDGTVTVTLPAGEAELRVTDGDAEGEVEFEFGEREADEGLEQQLDATATAENGTTVLQTTYSGEGVANATVTVEETVVGTTDADGTVTFPSTGDDELEVTLRKGALVTTLELEQRAGSFVLVEAEVEQEDEEDQDEQERETEREDEKEQETEEPETEEPETEQEDEEREEAEEAETEEPETEEPERDEDETEEPETEKQETEEPETEVEADGDLDLAVVGGSLEPGASVTIEVRNDSEAVAGAAVTVNGESAGTTGSDGTVTLTMPRGTDEVKMRAETDDRSGRLEIEFESAG